MSVTEATSNGGCDESELTGLAKGIATDPAGDSRSCKHEGCHGSLELDDSDRVVCDLCHCTLDGAYIHPDEKEDYDGDTAQARFCLQRDFFYPSASRRSKPNSRGQTPGVAWTQDDAERDRYDQSDNVILAGGFVDVYDETHPAGNGSSYEFDLSTL